MKEVLPNPMKKQDSQQLDIHLQDKQKEAIVKSFVTPVLFYGG